MASKYTDKEVALLEKRRAQLRQFPAEDLWVYHERLLGQPTRDGIVRRLAAKLAAAEWEMGAGYMGGVMGNPELPVDLGAVCPGVAAPVVPAEPEPEVAKPEPAPLDMGAMLAEERAKARAELMAEAGGYSRTSAQRGACSVCGAEPAPGGFHRCCTKCRHSKADTEAGIGELFGWRVINGVRHTQSQCRACRRDSARASRGA